MSEVVRVVLQMSPFAGYERGVLSGIARYARLHGRWILCLPGIQADLPLPRMEGVTSRGAILGGYCESPLRVRSLPNLRRLGATGFIGRIQTPADARAISEAGLPAIAMDLSNEYRVSGCPLSRLPEIRADSDSAGRMAADHFLERGFRHFAFCGCCGWIWSDKRELGFRQRLEENGFSCHAYVPDGRRHTESWTRERPRMIAWLSSLPKPIGIMACNDVYGLRVIEACVVGDIAVPDRVAVVGVDDDLVLCALSNPPLSSVLLNGELAGYQAAEFLDRMMAGDASECRTFFSKPLWVVPRRSTDVLAVADPEVARTLRYIHDNVQRSINVNDVIRELNVARRTLEIRFQCVLGRSIHSEIQQQRLARIKRLLAETDLPVSRIVEMVGFSNSAYASRVFRREVGVTLKSYRRNSRTP